EPLLPGVDAQHLAIVQPFGRPDPDGENRRAIRGPKAIAPAVLRVLLPRVTAIRQHDDAGNALAAISFAHGAERSREIGLPRVGAETIDVRGRQPFADAVDLGREL